MTKVMIWDALTARLIHSLEGHAKQSPQGFSSMLYTCAFSPDGTLLATADRIGEILLWELPSGKLLQKMSAPAMYTWDEVQRLRSIGGIRSLAFSTDQQTLAVGGMGHVQNVDGLGGKARVEWFDLQSGEPSGLFESDSHNGLVESLQYHPSEPYLIAAGGSGKGFLMLLTPSHEAWRNHPVCADRTGEDANSLLAVGNLRTAEWSRKTPDKPRAILASAGTGISKPSHRTASALFVGRSFLETVAPGAPLSLGQPSHVALKRPDDLQAQLLINLL